MEAIILAAIAALFLAGAVSRSLENRRLVREYPRVVRGKITSAEPIVENDPDGRHWYVMHRFLYDIGGGKWCACMDVSKRTFKLGNVGDTIPIRIDPSRDGARCVPVKALGRERMRAAVLWTVGLLALCGTGIAVIFG